MGSPLYECILYRLLLKTSKAIVVKNKSERVSDMNINFLSIRTTYHVNPMFNANDIPNMMKASIICLYLVCFFVVLVRYENLL